jgi:hypothetical protein
MGKNFRLKYTDIVNKSFKGFENIFDEKYKR